jgi:hypothetical protein
MAHHRDGERADLAGDEGVLHGWSREKIATAFF